MECYCIITRILVLFQIHVSQVYLKHRKLGNSASIIVNLWLFFMEMSWLGLQASGTGRRQKKVSRQLFCLGGREREREVLPMSKITEG